MTADPNHRLVGRARALLRRSRLSRRTFARLAALFGAAAADARLTLRGAAARTPLVLTASRGGASVTGRLDATSPFVAMRMLPRATPKLAHEYFPPWDTLSANGLAGYAGSDHRCGFEDLAPGEAGHILYVTNLSKERHRVGTLAWAATTNTDNDGNPLDLDKPCVVVFDVAGSIPSDNDDNRLRFTKNNRWFAGQTAPIHRTGQGGLSYHGVSRMEASNIRVEHISFFLGTTQARAGGPETHNIKSDNDHSVIYRNCLIAWGEDGNSDITNPGRYDRGTWLYNIWAQPNYDCSQKGKRGYQGLWNDGAHRMLLYADLMIGHRGARGPGIKPFCSVVSANEFVVPGSPRMVNRSFPIVNYLTNRDYQENYPRFRHITLLSCQKEDIPAVPNQRNQWVHHVNYTGTRNNIDQFLGRTYLYSDDETLIDGQVYQNDFATHNDSGGRNWYKLEEPPLLPIIPSMPREELRAHIRAHVGPFPKHRYGYIDWLFAKWDAGSADLIKDVAKPDPLGQGWDWQHPPAAPGGLPPTTSGSSGVPSEPWAVEANGRTKIENWLERKHIEVGGVSFYPFDRNVRFPWGGVVKIETNGTVTFSPEDMPSGEKGVIEVERGDGSVVSVTCQVG